MAEHTEKYQPDDEGQESLLMAHLSDNTTPTTTSEDNNNNKKVSSNMAPQENHQTKTGKHESIANPLDHSTSKSFNNDKELLSKSSNNGEEIISRSSNNDKEVSSKSSNNEEVPSDTPKHERTLDVEENESLPKKLSRENKHLAEGEKEEEPVSKKVSHKHNRAAAGEDGDAEPLRKKASRKHSSTSTKKSSKESSKYMDNQDTPAAVPKMKRKHRADEDEEHGTHPKASRQKYSHNSHDQAISNTKWRRLFQKKHNVEDDEQEVVPKHSSEWRRLYQKKHKAEDDEQQSLPNPSSTHPSTASKGGQGKVAKNLKRKRADDDEEHGSLPKVARSRSPSPEDARSSKGNQQNLKRKRQEDDNESGSLPKMARQKSPSYSSDAFDPPSPAHASKDGALPKDNSTSLLPALKRKRSPQDNEQGALSKAARQYLPVGSSETHSDGTLPLTPSKHALSDDCDGEDASASSTKRPRRSSPEPDVRASTIHKRKRTATSDSDVEEVAGRSPEKPRHAEQAEQAEPVEPIKKNTDCATPISPKRKRVTLPWDDADYPLNVKRARNQTVDDVSTHKEPHDPYEGLRYYRTERNSMVNWVRHGVLLGELTYLTAPPPPAPILLPKPSGKAKAKKKPARKPLSMPPKFEYKKEIKERYLVYAKFNHKMRFTLVVVPEQTIKTTEYRRTNAPKGKENTTAGKIPVVSTSTTEKISFRKQMRINLQQFDLLLECGRMIWEKEWKDIFDEGVKSKNSSAEDGEQEAEAMLGLKEVLKAQENVGEKVKEEMPGMMAVMREVMACPPRDERVQNRIRSFHATGKFDGRIP